MARKNSRQEKTIENMVQKNVKHLKERIENAVRTDPYQETVVEGQPMKSLSRRMKLQRWYHTDQMDDLSDDWSNGYRPWSYKRATAIKCIYVEYPALSDKLNFLI